MVVKRVTNTGRHLHLVSYTPSPRPNSRLSSKRTFLLNPRLQVHQTRVHLLQLRNVSLVPIAPEPVDHRPELRDHVFQDAAQEPERAIHRLAGLVLKRLGQLLVGELVTSQTVSLLVELLRALEGELGEDANVLCGDPLVGLGAKGLAHGGHEHLGREAGG